MWTSEPSLCSVPCAELSYREMTSMAGSSVGLGKKRAWCWKANVTLGPRAKEEFLPSRRQRISPVEPEILWMEFASRAEMM